MDASGPKFYEEG